MNVGIDNFITLVMTVIIVIYLIGSYGLNRYIGFYLRTNERNTLMLYYRVLRTTRGLTIKRGEYEDRIVFTHNVGGDLILIHTDVTYAELLKALKDNINEQRSAKFLYYVLRRRYHPILSNTSYRSKKDRIKQIYVMDLIGKHTRLFFR